MGVRAQNIERRKRAILAAARGMLARGRPEELKMRELAREAGLSVTTLYNLFANKDDILMAIVREGIASLAPLLERERSRDPLSALEQMIAGPVAHLVQHEAVFRPILRVGYHDIKGRGRAEVVELYASLLGLIERILGSARERGLLLPSAPTRLMAAEIFYTYRLALEDWICGEIEDDALERRISLGILPLLMAFAHPPTRAHFAAQLEALGDAALEDLERRFVPADAREGAA